MVKVATAAERATAEKVAKQNYDDRRKALLKKAKTEPDSVRRAHFRRQANCQEILEPLTKKDETARLKRQETTRDMLAIGEKNRKYAAENAKRLAAEQARRLAKKAEDQARHAEREAEKAEKAVDGGDNLTEISGIGPATASKLVAYGIDSFAKLAGMDEAAQARCKQALANPKADIADWVEQAAELISDDRDLPV